MYYFVDEAGNGSAVTKVRNDSHNHVWKFDNTPPTLSFVDNILPSGTDSYGHDAEVIYDINYSEGLRASAGNTVTYDTDGTSEITATAVNDVAKDAHKVNVSYTVKNTHTGTTDLTIQSFDADTWEDSAGNAMESYAFTGTSLSSGAAVMVDIEAPTLSVIDATPDNVLLGLYHETINPTAETEIKLAFSERVNLTEGTNITVKFNTSNSEVYTISSLTHDGEYPQGHSYGTIAYQPLSTFTNHYVDAVDGQVGDGRLAITEIKLSSNNNDHLQDDVTNNPNSIVDINNVGTELHVSSNIQVEIDPPVVSSITLSLIHI